MWHKTGTAVLLLLGVAATLAQQQTGNETADLYRNSNAPVEARIKDLLSRMNIQDKTAQLLQGDMANWINTTTGAFNETGLRQDMKNKASQFYVGHAVPWEWISQGVKQAQDYLRQNTTLGIPAFVQSESIHGFLVANATIFNSPIAHACSFNPELIEKMAKVIGQEAAALGVNQLFAPLADLARELRYGRVEETYGEDPYLTGEMAYSYVKGLQSENVSAMVKHYVGFSAPEQGLNTGPVHGGEREMRTTWMPPFKRAIIDAGAYSVMSAYHSYDGIPAVADYHTLTDVLRGEWGYKYFVVSDAGATDRLCKNFRMCETNPIDKSAITMYALPAGNDVEMGGGSFSFQVIPQLVQKGRLNISIVDEAVSRVLRAKFEMGLFEKPYSGVSEARTKEVIHSADSIKLARQLDAESIVLLENKNGALPLKREANIAVIGPMAHGYMNVSDSEAIRVQASNLSWQYGDYVTYQSQYRGVTPLDGLKAASKGKVTYSKGCERWSNDQSGFPEAIAAAKAADVAVVVVGTWSRDQTELWKGLNATTGEHVDVSTLQLVGAMAPLVRAVLDVGKPTIVVYSSGKPVTEPWISNRAAALVQQFYPSEEGGHALAEVLFGDMNPSGRLSVSIPYDIGSSPTYYDYLNSGREHDPGQINDDGSMSFGHQYVSGSPDPQYEFGYGKSYSTFTYSNLTLSQKTATAKDSVVASVTVWNTSKRDGTEVVQLYVEDLIASVAVPNRQMKGFKKVFIKAGSSEEVQMAVKIQDLGLWNQKMKYIVEPGEFRFWVGSSSKNLISKAVLRVN
jgi:beta-glucosidase